MNVYKLRWLVWSLVVALATGVVFSSCDDDGGEIIWDIGGVVIPIRILDDQGVNLLDPDVEGNWMDEAFSISYNDNLYTVDWDGDQRNVGEEGSPMSRAYLAVFEGLCAVNENVWRKCDWATSPNGHLLFIGEFPGDRDQMITVDLMVPGINTVFHIGMTHTIRWKNKEPVLNTYYTLNGQPVTTSAVTIILPHKTE